MIRYTKEELDKEAKSALNGHTCPDKGHKLHVRNWEIEVIPGREWMSLLVTGECKRCGYYATTNSAI